MSKLVIITQCVDEENDIVGFFVSWIREFARHFDQVVVITQKRGTYSLPPHVLVNSLGKELKRSKLGQLFRLHWHLIRNMRGADGVFVHMSPIFAVAVWPVSFMFRKKILLWYLHRAVSWKLRLANLLVYKIVTASRDSLNLRSRKIVELGHGIDITKFDLPVAPPAGDTFRIITVGRISPIKNLETLIIAADILRARGRNIKVLIIGRPVMQYDREYLDRLTGMVAEKNIKDIVHFIGSVPNSNIQEYYQKSDIVINLAPTGGIDKTVLEAMASRVLCVVANGAFRRYLGEYAHTLMFEHSDPVGLSKKIDGIISMEKEQKNKITTAMRNLVEKEHNLSNLILRIKEFYL